MSKDVFIEDNSKQFFDADITIHGNMIDTEKYTIQLSNVSAVWIGKLEKKKIEVLPVAIFIALGIALFFIGEGALPKLGGIILFALGVYPIAKRILAGEHYGLVFELNAGIKYKFISSDLNFLNDALYVIRSILYEGSKENKKICVMNFANGTIKSTVEGDIN